MYLKINFIFVIRMTEILLYGSIDGESSSDFIEDFTEKTANNEDIVVRVNTPGGNPEYTFGMVAKFSEYTGKKKIQVDGKAYSGGLYFLCYGEENESLDVSEFLLHRAAYPSYYENDTDFFTDAVKGNLERINKSLRKAFEAKVNVPLFEQLAKCNLDEVFSMETRIDVFFSADIAKKVGLISKINKITPTKKAEIDSYINSKMVQIAAEYKGATQEEIIKTNIMTLDELKAKHPELYAEAIDKGEKQGIAKEKDRVKSCLVFAEIDLVGVKAAIESGEALTATAMAEFMLKTASKKTLEIIEEEAAPEVKTKEVPASEKGKEDAEKEAWLKEVKQHLELN